jgi:hypothetical protein
MIEPPSLLRYFCALKEIETIGQADDRHLRPGLEEADARTDESGLILLEEKIAGRVCMAGLKACTTNNRKTL